MSFELIAAIRFRVRAFGVRFFELLFQPRGSVGNARFKLVGSCLQFCISEPLIVIFPVVDLLNVRTNPLDFSVVLGADDSLYPIHKTMNFLSTGSATEKMPIQLENIKLPDSAANLKPFLRNEVSASTFNTHRRFDFLAEKPPADFDETVRRVGDEETMRAFAVFSHD